MTFLDVERRSADGACRVVEQDLSLSRIHLSEQIARLLIVVVVDPMIPMCCRAVDLDRRFIEIRLIGPFAVAVRELARRSAQIAVGPHRAVAMIAVIWAFRSIDRDQVMVDSKAIARGISIGEQPCL